MMVKRLFNFVYSFTYYKTYRKFVSAQKRLWISKISVLLVIPLIVIEYLITGKVFYFVILEVALILFSLIREIRVASKGRAMKELSQTLPRGLGLKVIRLFPGSYKLKTRKNHYSLEIVIVERYNPEDLFWELRVKPKILNKITLLKNKSLKRKNNRKKEEFVNNHSILGGYISPTKYDEDYEQAIVDDVLQVLTAFQNSELETNNFVIYTTIPRNVLIQIVASGVEVSSMPSKMIKKNRVKPSIRDWRKDFTNWEESYPVEWITIELDGLKNNDDIENYKKKIEVDNGKNTSDDVFKKIEAVVQKKFESFIETAKNPILGEKDYDEIIRAAYDDIEVQGYKIDKSEFAQIAISIIVDFQISKNR